MYCELKNKVITLYHVKQGRLTISVCSGHEKIINGVRIDIPCSSRRYERCLERKNKIVKS